MGEISQSVEKGSKERSSEEKEVWGSIAKTQHVINSSSKMKRINALTSNKERRCPELKTDLNLQIKRIYQIQSKTDNKQLSTSYILVKSEIPR